MTAAGKDRNIKRPCELANVVKGEDRGRGPPDVAMGSAAAGERGLGQGPPPLQQVRILNSLIIMFRCFPNTQHITHTYVLGSVAMATLFRI